MVWSLLFNVLGYIGFSLHRQPSPIERLQANTFVPSDLTPITPSFRLWRSSVTVEELTTTIARYLGEARTRSAFESFAGANRISLEPKDDADFRLVRYAEHILASALGGALIWTIYVLLRGWNVPPVLASAMAAIVVGVLANWLARRHGAPVMPYVVPAIGPLLPGTALYRGMVELNTGSPQSGVLSLIGALSVALALGAGVNLGGELVRAFQHVGLTAGGRWTRPAARRTRGF